MDIFCEGNGFVDKHVRSKKNHLVRSKFFIRTIEYQGSKIGVKFSKNYKELEIWDCKPKIRSISIWGMGWANIYENVDQNFKNIQVSADIYWFLQKKSVCYPGNSKSGRNRHFYHIRKWFVQIRQLYNCSERIDFFFPTTFIRWRAAEENKHFI